MHQRAYADHLKQPGARNGHDTRIISGIVTKMQCPCFWVFGNRDIFMQKKKTPVKKIQNVASRFKTAKNLNNASLTSRGKAAL